MLAIDAAMYLHSQGIVTFDEDGAEGNAFIEALPSTPDLAVGIFSAGGAAPEVRNALDRPALMFVIRGGSDPRAVQMLARQIWTAWHGLTKTELAPGGVYVGLARARESEPVAQGPDESGRHRYSVTIDFITRRP